MHSDVDCSHLLAIVSSSCFYLFCLRLFANVCTVFGHHHSWCRQFWFRLKWCRSVRLAKYQGQIDQNFWITVFCLMYFQLAVLFHGTNESIDRTQIASNGNTDRGQRMGQLSIRHGHLCARCSCWRWPLKHHQPAKHQHTQKCIKNLSYRIAFDPIIMCAYLNRNNNNYQIIHFCFSVSFFVWILCEARFFGHVWSRAEQW